MRDVAAHVHEIRGALATVALIAGALDRLGGQPAELGAALEAATARARPALSALAGSGEQPRIAGADALLRAQTAGWRALAAAHGKSVDVVTGADGAQVTDADAFVQLTANLVANAIEHGHGPVQVASFSSPRGLGVDVRDEGRGHGLRVASSAAARLGGTLV